MFGKRAERRRQARAAIERYEQQARAAQYVHEGDVAERDRALAEAREQRAKATGLSLRLDDANAELRRWGLEPVVRDEAVAEHAPQRYRRSSDWRTTRSGDELAALLERSGLDEWEPEPQGDREATTEEAARERSTCPECGREVAAPAGSYACWLSTPAGNRLHARTDSEPAAITGEGYVTFEEFGTRAEVGHHLREAVRLTLEETGDRIAEAAKVGPRGAPPRKCGEPPQSNADLVAQMREALELGRECARVGVGRTAALAAIDAALARLNPDDPMCIVSGEVHDGLAHALADQGEAAHAIRLELRACEDERDGLRESLELEKARSRDRREADLAMIAHELGWPGEEPITVSGLCLRVRDVLTDTATTRAREAEAELGRVRDELGDALTAASEAEGQRDDARALHEAARAEYRSADNGRREALAELEGLRRQLAEALESDAVGDGVIADVSGELDEARQALTAERTEREQAERSRDRAQSVNLDLQRWREKERDTLAAFVNALGDAAQRGTLHIDLVAPYQRAAALLEDPEA